MAAGVHSSVFMGPSRQSAVTERNPLLPLALCAAVAMSALALSAFASPGVHTTVGSACHKLGGAVRGGLDLADCASCHGQPWRMENPDNPFWTAYHDQNWPALCNLPGPPDGVRPRAGRA